MTISRGFFDSISTSYNNFIRQGDIRAKDWPLVYTPWPCCIITVFYILFAIWGKNLMKNHRPWNLKFVLLSYNVAMMAQSAYIFKEFLLSAYQSNYSLICQPLEKVITPQAMRIASASWWFFISKIIEMFDTVFLVLRKKEEQLSFLHIFHHGTMVVNQWLGVKFVPGGHAFIQGLLNSFIHVVMYGYYFLSALGPKLRKYLWWKKYLTTLQLIQFSIIIVHTCVGIAINCEFPWWIAYYVTWYCVILLALFTNFYIQEYRRKKKKLHKN